MNRSKRGFLQASFSLWAYEDRINLLPFFFKSTLARGVMQVGGELSAHGSSPSFSYTLV